MDFSCCCDTCNEEYIVIEAEGAASLDANIEIDVVGGRNDNFEATIDVDFDSDTENEAVNDTGAADDIDWVVTNVTDDEAVRWNDDCVSEKDGVGKTETDSASEDCAEKNTDEDAGGDTVIGSSADNDDDRGKNLDAVGDTESDAEFTIGSVTDVDTKGDPRKDVVSSDTAEMATCTDPDSCSDINFEGNIDDSSECARDNGADGDANMDSVSTNGIDDSFDTDTDGVCDNSGEGRTVIDFNMDSDADVDTDGDSGSDSEREGRFAGFSADDETVRNVGDKDTYNKCETDMDVLFDNDIEGTACFETDADSDNGVVCNTDDRDADIDFVCDNKLDGDTVSDCNAGTDENTGKDDGRDIVTDAEYADKDFFCDIDTDDNRDTVIDVECDNEIEGTTEKDFDGDSDTDAGSDTDDTSSDDAENEADDAACETSRVEDLNRGVVGDSNADADANANGDNENNVDTNTETVWDTDANTADDINNVSSRDADSDAEDATEGNVDWKVYINADPEGNGQTDFDVSADNDTEGDNDTNVVASDSIEAVVEVSDGVCNCVWDGVEYEDWNCRQITKMLKTLITGPVIKDKMNQN